MEETGEKMRFYMIVCCGKNEQVLHSVCGYKLLN